MSVLEVLLAGKKRLVEKGWTKRHMARDASGSSTNPRIYGGRVIAHSPYMTEPTSFCALGACTLGEDSDAEATAWDLLSEAIGGALVSFFNDAQKSVEPVLVMYDRAIELARSRGV